MIPKLLLSIIIIVFTSQTNTNTKVDSDSDKSAINYQKSFENCLKNHCKKHKITDNIKCFQTCQNLQKKQAKSFSKSDQTEFLSNLKSFPENFCLNKIPKKDLTKKQILIEFAKGPCSPLMLVPGVMGSKLTVEINCEELKLNEFDVFKSCGWTDCEKKRYEFWKSVPESEYQLWIPSLTGPLNIFSISEQTNFCFAKLIKPHINLNEEINKMVQPRKGVVVKVYGFSENTKNKNDCGDGAIRDFMAGSIQEGLTFGFKQMIFGLLKIGYVSGLTMQSMPYNFYYSYRQNEFNLNFFKNLLRLKRLTGKKVGIIGHSMGNTNILYSLNQLDKETIKNTVYNYLAISPAFLGSLKSNKVLVGGNDEFTTFYGNLGFHFGASVYASSNQFSMYEMCAVDAFSVYKDEPWFENILKRMNYEKNPSVGFDESGIPFWPSIEDICHEEGIIGISPFCSLGVYDTNKPVIQIGEDSYRIREMRDLFNKYKLTPSNEKMYNKLYNENLAHLSPKVPTAIVYMAAIPTFKSIKYKSNYYERINNSKFPEIVEKTMGNGDNTVATFSSILPGLKWAFNFEEQKKNENQDEHYPVKFIEYCSTHKSKEKLYNINEEGENQILKNGYIGINCQCIGKGVNVYKNCKHTTIHEDPSVIGLVFEFAFSKQVASEESIEYIEKLDEEELERDIKECSHIVSHIFE